MAEPTTLAKSKDSEIFLALKRISTYLVNEAWHTSSDDSEYNYAVEQTHQYETDIKMLAAIDEDSAYGEMTRKAKDGAYITKLVGDLNPWYEGSLKLDELLDSISHLVEVIDSQVQKNIRETEFLHYYFHLKYVHGKVSSLILNHGKAEIRFENLHPKIQQHCEDRYYSHQYADAILAAYKVVLNEIKQIANIHDLDGKPLAEKALSISNPLIKLNNLVTQSDKDEQLGFMMLFSGAAVGIRNPKAHDLIVQNDETKALRYLSFASLLLERLDERISPQ